MSDEIEYCMSCKHYGVDTQMVRHIWETWDGENEHWGYYYECPVCGRTEGYPNG